MTMQRFVQPFGSTAIDIEAICGWLANVAPGALLICDSRRINPGDVFVALAAAPEDGILVDTRAFIDEAIERGARAVVFDNDAFAWCSESVVPHHGVSGLRRLSGMLASRHYGAPDRDMFSVAVTGTNGKTSCTQWLGSALSHGGHPTAVIGTLGVGLFKAGETPVFEETGYTTPDAMQLQRALARVRQQGAGALAIEASSIGLHQQRMDGLHVDAALFTNLTRDHLDYHGDMAAYEAVKTRLFDWPGLRYAIINIDDPMGLRLIARLRQRSPQVQITVYGLKAPPENLGNLLADTAITADPVVGLFASQLRSTHIGTQFQLQYKSAMTSDAPSATVQIKTRMVGAFNVSNVLGVLGVLLAKGSTLPKAVIALEALQPVPGRMQQLGVPDQPLVVIDYAHTPDALEKTLASLRSLALARHGALWCVFGCGGERDAGKRAQMGAVAQAADHVIVTSDNPRNETPAAIIADIVAGTQAGIAQGRPVPQVIEDRAMAILWALRHAAKTDVVLLAGKGHESYQEIKGKKLHFLDADHAALALAARATMKGAA